MGVLFCQALYRFQCLETNLKIKLKAEVTPSPHSAASPPCTTANHFIKFGKKHTVKLWKPMLWACSLLHNECCFLEELHGFNPMVVQTLSWGNAFIVYYDYSLSLLSQSKSMYCKVIILR